MPQPRCTRDTGPSRPPVTIALLGACFLETKSCVLVLHITQLLVLPLQKEHKGKEASSTEAATGATADISAPTADIPAPTAEAPADDPAATDNQATVELGKGEQDDALQRQYNPKGDPTPMELPPEAQKAKEDADQAALEGEESGEAGQGEPSTADTSNSVEVGHHFV